MLELNTRDYKKILPLIENIKRNRALIYSVVEGKNNGRIFVDDDINPKTAYIFCDFGFSFIVGDEHNESFNKHIDELIFDDILEKMEEKELVLFPCTEKWKSKLEELLSHRGVIKIHRKTFDFIKTYYKSFIEKEIQLPEGLALKNIDQEFANQYSKHKDISESASKFGFCLVNENEIISECCTVAVGGGEAEIDINTNENYRRKRFATIVATAFIDYCLENNIVPNWSCWPFREESILLAKKLGFEEKQDIPAIYWSPKM